MWCVASGVALSCEVTCCWFAVLFGVYYEQWLLQELVLDALSYSANPAPCSACSRVRVEPRRYVGLPGTSEVTTVCQTGALVSVAWFRC